ncbi:hypothetical protein [Planctomyces sp. SH-PL62]|uniref:hypothetical protein n=1 Tax=Planctomyces sp. SH-PL62 TaxID=1636152 RepID=UPI00078D8DEB|nr:hypothetical protein [Planctomyces sp. SH-PL62]AMV40672.1 hypothetical protein VT85_24790 [Planctomyces sp. SH-PL62]
MDPIRERAAVQTRRSFFGRAGALSFGAAALADLLAREGIAGPAGPRRGSPSAASPASPTSPPRPSGRSTCT